MALDFHITTTGDPSEPGWPAWSIEMEMHELLFFRSIDLRGCVQLIRMVDYFSDVEYSVDDLPTLLADLDVVIPKLAARSSLREALRGFREICVRAQAEGKSLYGFCD